MFIFDKQQCKTWLGRGQGLSGVVPRPRLRADAVMERERERERDRKLFRFLQNTYAREKGSRSCSQ